MLKVLITSKVTDPQLEELRRIAPDAEIVRELDPAKARELFREADILCGFQLPGPLEEARNLKWIQLISAGAEHVLKSGVQNTDLLITTVSGIHGFAMAEYTIWAMVTLARRMSLVQEEMKERKWRPSRLRTYYGEELHGSTVGVLGLGGVGRQIASTLRCLGMRVLGLTRSGVGPEGLAEKVYSPQGLLEMLGECDWVVVALPLTAETRRLVGEQELRAMKPTARLINVGRGELVDEEAVARALREGWIGGAALDVFCKEPLPANSELWDLPNLVLTPHMSGNTLPYMDRAAEVFRENLRRYLAGEPMMNVLDKTKGY